MAESATTLAELWREADYVPNDAQEEAIRHVAGPLYLPAGPGSGKTAVLLWRTLNLLVFHDVAPRHVFLSTFTEKAALQLKERLQALLGVVSNRFPSLKSKQVARMKEALEGRDLSVYAPRAGGFLDTDEGAEMFGVLASILGTEAVGSTSRIRRPERRFFEDVVPGGALDELRTANLEATHSLEEMAEDLE